jgi:Flp pilus assembly protein TadG
MVLLLAVAFNGWDGIQLDINLTSAARAGAVAAAESLVKDPTADYKTAAVNAINEEEGTTAVYQTNPSLPDYVTVTTAPQAVSSGPNINVVTVSISNVSVTLVPVVGAISLSTHASARYS